MVIRVSGIEILRCRYLNLGLWAVVLVLIVFLLSIFFVAVDLSIPFRGGKFLLIEGWGKGIRAVIIGREVEFSTGFSLSLVFLGY